MKQKTLKNILTALISLTMINTGFSQTVQVDGTGLPFPVSFSSGDVLNSISLRTPRELRLTPQVNGGRAFAQLVTNDYDEIPDAINFKDGSFTVDLATAGPGTYEFRWSEDLIEYYSVTLRPSYRVLTLEEGSNKVFVTNPQFLKIGQVLSFNDKTFSIIAIDGNDVTLDKAPDEGEYLSFLGERGVGVFQVESLTPFSQETTVAGVKNKEVLRIRLHNNSTLNAELVSLGGNLSNQGSNTAHMQNYNFAGFSKVGEDFFQIGSTQHPSLNGDISFKSDPSFEALDLTSVPAGGSREILFIVDTTEESVGDVVQFVLDRIELRVSDNSSTNAGERLLVEEGPLPVSPILTLIESGSLSVESIDFDEDSNVLVEEQESVLVWRGRFIAIDDDVEVKDIYLENIGDDGIEERLDFELRYSSGSLIQSRTMVNNQLHFELANSSRIRVPKDDFVEISVFADVRDINNFSQTGKRLQLRINTAERENGFEANTVATGRDLASHALNAAQVQATGPEFVVYKTKLTVETALTQPNLVENSGFTPLYRFNVIADAAGEGTLEQFTQTFALSSDIAFNQIPVSTDFEVYRDGVWQAVTNQIISATTTSATVQFTFGDSQPINGVTQFEVVSKRPITETSSNEDFDFVSAVFEIDSEYSAPTFTGNRAADIASLGSNFVWTDRSNSGLPGPYLNGYLLAFPDTANSRGASN